MASPITVEVYVTPDSGLMLMIWYDGDRGPVSCLLCTFYRKELPDRRAPRRLACQNRTAGGRRTGRGFALTWFLSPSQIQQNHVGMLLYTLKHSLTAVRRDIEITNLEVGGQRG